MEKIFFATGNSGKVEELQPLFEKHGFELEQVEVNVEEVQAVDAEKVARHKVVDSYRELDVDSPVMVDDTGFFVNALGGFPGSLAYFFSSTVGVDGLVPLMKDVDDRSAYFETAIALYDGDEVKIFTGRVDGKVPEEARGEPHPHLPYDQFFVPEHGEQTYAEDSRLKEEYSHRKRAAENLLDWLED